MESSKFIQLTEDVLLEYIYNDQSNPTSFSTSSHKFEIMKNLITNATHVFNSSANAEDIGNYRDISAVPISVNKTEWVSLNTSLGVPYNDKVTQLTSTPDLLATFSPDINVEYDTLRFHFTSGFNFQDFDGYIFNIQVDRRDSVQVDLANVKLLRSDTPVFNGDPFLLAEKLYSTYIEFRIPSLFYMMTNFNSSVPNSLGYKITDGQGFLSNGKIKIKLLGIFETVIENSYRFFKVNEVNQTSILNRDIYDTLSANLIESNTGDYFELSGQVNNDTLSNFISRLNQRGGDYIIFHQISISEQINGSFIKTSDQMFNQISNFDTPILFRPIILNSSVAQSFAIDYTMRLFNRNDNTQIIKKARIISYETKKYGRKLLKLNLGTAPTLARVYNKIVSDNVNNIMVTNKSATSGELLRNGVTERLVLQPQFISSFRDRINIKAAISSVKIQNIQENE